MLLLTSLSVLGIGAAATLFRRTRIIGIIGIIAGSVGTATSFAFREADPVRFEGALGAIQLVSLRAAPELPSPESLREVAEQRCGTRTACTLVFHPDSASAKAALAAGDAELGAIAIYAIDMLRSQASFVTRCGVWAVDAETCY